MKGIEKARNEIQKKLKLQDYKSNPQQIDNAALPQNGKTSSNQDVKSTKSKKTKLTVYLSEEAFFMFKKMCSERMFNTGKCDRSELICAAIKNLYNSKT